MRRVDILSGALLTLIAMPGCKVSDAAQIYLDWTTQVKPTVECNKGQPTLHVGFKTLATNTEKVVLKATSDVSGRTAEQELTQQDVKGKEISGTPNFRTYKYNLRGEKEEVSIPSGDVITLRVYGIDRIKNAEGEVVHVRPLKEAIQITADCPVAVNRLAQ